MRPSFSRNMASSSSFNANYHHFQIPLKIDFGLLRVSSPLPFPRSSIPLSSLRHCGAWILLFSVRMLRFTRTLLYYYFYFFPFALLNLEFRSESEAPWSALVDCLLSTHPAGRFLCFRWKFASCCLIYILHFLFQLGFERLISLLVTIIIIGNMHLRY